MIEVFALKKLRAKFIIRQQHLGDQIKSAWKRFRQINVVKILARNSGHGGAATSQVAIRIVKSVTRAKLAIRARAFFDRAVKDHDAERAFRGPAGRSASQKTCASIVAGAIGFLVKHYAEFQILVMRIEHGARGRAGLIIAIGRGQVSSQRHHSAKFLTIRNS